MKYELPEELSRFYAFVKKPPAVVTVPKMSFIMFDGAGHPDGSDFQIAAEALYTVSYTLKFEIARKKLGSDYKVMPLEVRWKLDRTGGKSFSWTMMIMQPPFITEALCAEAIEIAIEKGKNIEHERLRLEAYEEGLCVQACHAGDYTKMNDTLRIMKEFAEDNHLVCENDTHDIYLNDSRKTKIENLKTIRRLKARPDYAGARWT